MTGLRLNVGAGPLHWPGEIGIDREAVSAADVRADIMALPFRDGSAEFVRLDHVLEHQEGRYAVPALLEAYRVLVPGGRLHVGVPDLTATCRAYVESDDLQEKAALLRNLYGSQTHQGEYHRSGWDTQTLADILTCVGFAAIIVAPDPDRDEGICIQAEAVRP